MSTGKLGGVLSMRYRFKLLQFLLLVFFASLVLAQQGPFVDSVYINVRTDKSVGLQDAVNGVTDVFFFGVEGPDIFGMGQDALAKLDLYTVPSGTWSILFNPIPAEAPYIVNVNGRDYFNPFGMQEIRYAMNFLINRKFIVDEILQGAGGVMFTMATPGQPGTYKYNLIPLGMGMTPEGDEQSALKSVNDAMTKASNLPALKGRLVKGAKWWMFDKEPVTVKFVIRVDDPGRSKEGEYISNQIEKAGIMVERLMWDRAKAGKVVYNGNPAKYEWSLYTEGWGAGATRAWWEHIVAQMYANWFGYIPGGSNPDFWNFKTPKIDELTQKAYSGNFVTTDEYWNYALEGLKLGIEDSVRIYIAYQQNYYAAHKASFNDRFAYGLGDGPNNWSFVTANTANKILRVTEFSARGSLFMSAWDPIGPDGFSDVYSNVIAGPLYDAPAFESPVSALTTPLRATWKDVRSDVGRNGDGNVVGKIDVPSTALRYNSNTQKWELIGTGVKSMSVGTYNYIYGNYHNGMPVTLAAIMYANAFTEDWITKNGTDDRRYESTYESYLRPVQETFKGMVVNSDGSFTNYFDYNFPPSIDRTAGWGVPGISVSAAGQPVAVSWDIDEALALLVTEGSKSGTVYSFSSDPAYTEVDVLSPSCVADIRAKLVEMRDNKYVPVYIKDYITPDEAIKYYEASIKWIDEHGHAYISNGPFYMNKYDPSNNFVELKANRDKSYPFTGEYWANMFKTLMPRIDNVDVLAITPKGMDVNVGITVSSVAYPQNTSSMAKNADVSMILITPNKEYSFVANMIKDGYFESVIPGSVTENIESGTYTLLVNANMPGAIPASSSVPIIIY